MRRRTSIKGLKKDKEETLVFNKTLLAITCHEAYIKYLRRCLESCYFFGDIVVYLDNCTCPFEIRRDFQHVSFVTVYGKRGPNKLRNKGLKDAISLHKEWIIYFDSDNVFSEGYFEKLEISISSAVKNTGIVKSSAGDENKKINLSEANSVDTSSAWRVSALSESGGWDETLDKFDDWSAALRVKSLGYTILDSFAPIKRDIHEENRSGNGKKTLYRTRSLTVLTLFGKGSSKFLEGLFSYFVKERFSSKTEFLFVIDNNVEISDRKRISNFSFLLLTKGYSVKILNNQVVGFGDNFSSSKKYERHAKVCSIYNSVLKYIQTDVLYLVEDDNLPSVGTFEKLSFHIYPKTNIVAASAKYRSRATPDKSCCSLSLDKWTPEDYNGTDLKFVKMTGGGCLVILSYIFKEAFPLQCTKNEIGNISLGWDASLGKYINSKGKKIILDKSVECKHLAKEVLDFLENKQDKKENYGRQHSSLL